MGDPTAQLVSDARRVLSVDEIPASNLSLGRNVRWTPHLYQTKAKRAWYCLPEVPDSRAWADRMERARDAMPSIELGVAAPGEVLLADTVLRAVDRLGAAVLPVRLHDGEPELESRVRSTVAELIYEEKIRLTPTAAREILDRNLDRAIAERNPQKKGVRLEVVTALLLSQVAGYEVFQRGISNRSQQIDVLVHNRNSGGVLGAGEVVLAEAKNWTFPVGVEEYSSLHRKLTTKHRRARLAFFITTDRFTAGIDLESRADSTTDYLIVRVDGELLPNLWRTGSSITANVEAAVLRAIVGR